jgi:membrane-bound transcription factor site-1 protease
MAPDAELYILKLFTDDDVTFSSWFIDAFNFVLDNNIDIVNLSTASKDS